MADRAVAMVRRFCKIADTIEIDSCKEETHTLSNTVTDHPVEEGYNITDHVRPDPDMVTLTCFISNTPLSLEQVSRSVREGSVEFQTSSSEDVAIGDAKGRGNTAYEKLKKLRREGTLISVVTSLCTYGVSSTEGMAIQSISIPRTSKNYDGLEFSITLKQVRIVKNRQTRDSQPREKNTTKKQKKGAQTPKEGTLGPEEDQGSALYQSGKFRPST